MKIGIMAIQINEIIPTDIAPDQIMSHIVNFDQLDLVQRLSDHGFKWIELGGDLSLFMPNSFSPKTIQRLAQLKTQYELSYTVHLPLWSVEPSTPLQPVRRGSVQAIVDCIQATAPLEPEVYVLHATGALAAEFYRMDIPASTRALILRQFQSNAAESIRNILAETSIPSRRLAVETIEFPFELTLELAQLLDLSICLDTGHVLVGFSGPVDIFTAVDLSLTRLAEIHLHDGPLHLPGNQIGYGLDHQALGKGDLDVKRFFNRLSEGGFDGPVIFELDVAQAVESRNTLHKLVPNIF